jgi:hypothetical protein
MLTIRAHGCCQGLRVRGADAKMPFEFPIRVYRYGDVVMTGFVVPFETHQTNSRVWVAWWSKFQRPPLALRVQNLWRPDTITQHAFAENLTTDYANIGTTRRIASDPVVLDLRSGESPTQHAFARNSDGELIHYWWSAEWGWRAENPTTDAYRIASDPVAITVLHGLVVPQSELDERPVRRDLIEDH